MGNKNQIKTGIFFDYEQISINSFDSIQMFAQFVCYVLLGVTL